MLLWQVACEFISASRKLAKQGFTAADAWKRLAEFMDVFPLVPATADVLRRAQHLHLAHQVAFWDAMILASAAIANVEVVYSEDLPGHTNLQPVRVINPFELPSPKSSPGDPDNA